MPKQGPTRGEGLRCIRTSATYGSIHANFKAVSTLELLNNVYIHLRATYCRASACTARYYFTFQSVCPSVRLYVRPVTAVSKGMHMPHIATLFCHSGRGTILVFEPHCRYKIPMRTP